MKYVITTGCTCIIHYISLGQAAHDDMIPLGTPIKTASGQTVDSIFVAKGSSILVPIRYMNRSKFLWGDDALEFKPSRWLSSESGIPDKAKEVHGWAHMLTFSDGPRTCLGRQFALTEFKVRVGCSVFLISVSDSGFLRLSLRV